MPGTKIRPSELTESALAPTVNFIPAKPLKLLRRGGLFRANPVRKLTPPLFMIVESIAVAIAEPPPDTLAMFTWGEVAFTATLTVSVMG